MFSGRAESRQSVNVEGCNTLKLMQSRFGYAIAMCLVHSQSPKPSSAAQSWKTEDDSTYQLNSSQPQQQHIFCTTYLLYNIDSPTDASLGLSYRASKVAINMGKLSIASVMSAICCMQCAAVPMLHLLT